jgi:putative oxygen-independent coproporphyrinogen III oxidase
LNTSVYVHFPWCLKKCPYCDFNSHKIDRTSVPHAAYADAVIAELSARGFDDRSLTSVFFGGGTPSLWDAKQLGRVLRAITKNPERVEVTVECNPTSLDDDKIQALLDTGVNRFSIGVQSLDEERLKFLGRLHDAKLALEALSLAAKRCSRVSGDLMFGSPGQSAEDFLDELKQVLDTGVEHVSAYALTIEPNTQFGELHKKGRLPLAKDDDYAETFVRTSEFMRARGFEHYEVSNYARPGQRSVHNAHYWAGGDYLGLGAGAFGALSKGDLALRYRNQTLPERYLEHAADLRRLTVFEEQLSAEDRVREAIMLGLRTRNGVDVREVQARTGLDVRTTRGAAIARRVGRGELEVVDDHLRVPEAHWLALDAIVTDLF